MGQSTSEIASSLLKAVLLSFIFFTIIAIFFFSLEAHLEKSKQRRIREKNMTVIYEMLKKRNKSE
jgi:hypothetical protein